jgi:hypothetical protein
MNSFVFLLYISIFNNYWMRLSMIWRIIKPKVIKANWGLDNYSYCVKTEFNNCFIIYFKNSKQTEAICILFVLRENNSLFLRQPSSSSYQWRQWVNMILVVIVIWRKHVKIFFILTLWHHFANMNVKNPYLVSHWVDVTISQLAAVSQSETRNF